LVKPGKELENAAQEYKQEHFENGENVLHGGSLLDQLTLLVFLINLIKGEQL